MEAKDEVAGKRRQYESIIGEAQSGFQRLHLWSKTVTQPE